MKPFFSILLFILLLTSCNKKTVLLPEMDNKDITKILDVSPAYIFYDETKKDSVEFNRKNLIGTTNWLVNIDKRLTLKQIMPHLVYLQEKRSKDGMHKNKNAKNYFTCSNPGIQNLAFIEFTDVVFHTSNTDYYYDRIDKTSKLRNGIYIDIKTKTLASVNEKNVNIDNLLNYLNTAELYLNSTETHIHLSINKDLTFQDYITYKNLFLRLDLPNVTFTNDEIIY